MRPRPIVVATCPCENRRRANRSVASDQHPQRYKGPGSVMVAEPTLVVATFAGLASFLSPCMLPVIPAFLAQLAGTSLDLSDLQRRDVLLGTVLFVAGFSAVFATLGVVLGTVLENAATEVLTWLSRLAGTVVIVLGLHLTSLLRLPVLDRQYAARPTTLKPGNLASFLFGA